MDLWLDGQTPLTLLKPDIIYIEIGNENMTRSQFASVYFEHQHFT